MLEATATEKNLHCPLWKYVGGTISIYFTVSTRYHPTKLTDIHLRIAAIFVADLMRICPPNAENLFSPGLDCWWDVDHTAQPPAQRTPEIAEPQFDV